MGKARERRKDTVCLNEDRLLAKVGKQSNKRVKTCTELRISTTEKTISQKNRPAKNNKAQNRPHKPKNVDKSQSSGVSCYECEITENSEQYLKLAQGWIQCCRCKLRCHEPCGEIGGILDDEEVLCAQCALKR